MLSFLEMLEMRGHLKQIQKEDLTVVFFFIDGIMTVGKVKSVGLTTVTLDSLAEEDEETWLASFVFPISTIHYINTHSTDRARRKLMNDAGEHCEDCSKVVEDTDEE